MTINTITKKNFALLDENKIAIAQLIYTSSAFDDAIIETAEKYLLNGIAIGIWVTHLGNDNSVKTKSKIRVETGGIISVSLPGKKRNIFLKNRVVGSCVFTSLIKMAKTC